jgi:uncharacterized protein YjbI with pentapeptide repeats
MMPKYMRDLRRKMKRSRNVPELQELAHDLGVDWEDLPGKTKTEMLISLINRQARRGDLGDLIELLREDDDRPDETWDDPPPKEQQIEDAKADISEAERRDIFDNLIDKVGPLASSVLQIKTLVEANIGYLNTRQTGDLIRLLANVNLASYVKLEAISVVNEDLRNANLSGANLYNANLSGAVLYNANLSRADLCEADLSGADLTKADLIKAVLIGADLSEARLIGANLSFAKLDEANLREAHLRIAYLGGADFTLADLTKADLTNADLTKAKISDSQLASAILDETTTMPNGEKWKPS